jgi:hypothetical protein
MGGAGSYVCTNVGARVGRAVIMKLEGSARELTDLVGGVASVKTSQDGHGEEQALASQAKHLYPETKQELGRHLARPMLSLEPGVHSRRGAGANFGRIWVRPLCELDWAALVVPAK